MLIGEESARMGTTGTQAQPGEFDIDGALRDLIERKAVNVPPYPAVALRVQELVRRESFGLAELTACVASDQSLAADALHVANSAVYSRGHQATTLNQAVTRIGAREIARLAIASGLGAQARVNGPLATLRRRVWLEGLACAGVAQELARCRGLQMEEGFLVGLLHDFGKVVAIACIEDLLGRRRAVPRPFGLWAALLDRFHRDFGLVVAARWKLPDFVTDAIALHHADDYQQASQPKMIELVRDSDAAVQLLLERLWLTPDDLRAVPALNEREREHVALTLERLPGFLASFEGPGDMPPGRSALVQQEPPAELDRTYPLDQEVKVWVARYVLDYRAVGIAPELMVLSGLHQLPEHVLMEVRELRLPDRAPFSLWVTGFRSWKADNGAQFMLVRPIALNAASRERWEALLREPLAPAVR
jgi:HD-like signal output (HDOD) protein